MQINQEIFIVVKYMKIMNKIKIHRLRKNIKNAYYFG